MPELIKIADGKKFTENYKVKHNVDVMYGWYRYSSRFALPVFGEDGEIIRYNVFNVVMVIRHARDGKKYLYDIINIKKETSTLFQTTDEKMPMNAVQISQKLEEEYGMENVHRTSIYNDVRLLQSCGYPIKQAENSYKGWYMEKHLLEDWEIKLMLDSVQQARCVSVHEANEIRKKLLNLTSQRGRSRFSHMIMPLPGNVRCDGRIGEYIEIMLEAMYLHKKIRFQYTEINNAMEKVLRKEGKMYQLNLYTIYWSDNNYYLIGSHDNHDGLTNYRLDRIENMSMSGEEAIPAEEKIGVNPELVIQDYIKKSVNLVEIRSESKWNMSRHRVPMLYYMILQGTE